MIWPWNRTEASATFSQEQYFRVSGALRDAGIAFVTKMPGMMSADAGRGRGIPGVNQNWTQEYLLYVRRDDAPRAQMAVQECLRVGDR